MNAAELAIKETKVRIKELNRESQKTNDPTAQLHIQEQLQEESRKQKKQRQEICAGRRMPGRLRLGYC